jgi:hypothetical protein
VLFRRNAAEAQPPAAPATGAATPGGKGRPTPSRKEAEQARRQRAKPPTDRRSAARAQRTATREDRLKAREAMLRGDERYMHPRDQGPVRRFVRDYVDAKRTVGEFVLPVMVVFILLTLFVNKIPSVTVRGYVVLVTYAFMLVVILGTAFIAFSAKREVTRRFGAEQARGTVVYASMRSLQIRRWRLPKPKVRPGDPV